MCYADRILIILPSGQATVVPGGGLSSPSWCWPALPLVSTRYMNPIMSGTSPTSQPFYQLGLNSFNSKVNWIIYQYIIKPAIRNHYELP